MGNAQVTIRDTQLEKQRIGLLQLSMTNFGNTSEPAIAAGSVVEIGGSLFVFTSNEAITGWGAIGNDTDCYIRLPYNGPLTAEFTTVAPTWSASKQGWYDGIKRYVGGLRRGASAAVYENKWIYQRSQDDNAGHRFYGDGTVDIDAGIKGDLPVGSIMTSAAGGALIGPIADAEAGKRLWPTYIAFAGWDMNANATFDVDLTVPDFRTVYSVTGRLVASTPVTYFSIPHIHTDGIPQLWVDNINLGDVTLRRLEGGIFDHGDYEAAVGVLLIWHGEIVTG